MIGNHFTRGFATLLCPFNGTQKKYFKDFYKATDYRLQISDYRLHISDYRSPITDYRSPIPPERAGTHHPTSSVNPQIFNIIILIYIVLHYILLIITLKVNPTNVRISLFMPGIMALFS
jgi:hypothetical protein